MDIDKLRYLINCYEGPKLDFKERFSLEEEHEKKEFVKDVCAIANSRGARGYIIYGIKDKTMEIVGVEKEELEEERIQQIVTNRTEPPVQIRIENVDLDGKNLIVLTIFKSDCRPHQMRQNGSFYIRRGSTTDVARRDEIASMLQESGVISFETILMGQLTLDMLNWDLIDKYLNKFKELKNDDKYILANALGIIKKDSKSEHYHPTMGGMLIFGRDVQTFLPNTGIKIYSKLGTYYITGTINQMLDSALEKCKEILKIANYPYKAIDLALANALVHRDYFDTNRCTTIRFFENRIEITNPGAFQKSDKVDKMTEQDINIKRNPWLYERLIMLDEKERYLRRGIGINTIKSCYQNKNEVKFINILKYNSFKVILPL